MFYLFQIRAATHLPVEDLGELNVWLTYYMLALVLGQVAQYWAVFSPISGVWQTRLKWISWGVSFATVLFCLGLWRTELPEGFCGALVLAGIPSAILVQYWQGVSQSRQAFLFFGVVSFALGLSRWVLAIPAADLKFFYLAIILATAVVLPIQLLNRKIFTQRAVEVASAQKYPVIFAVLTGLGWALLPSYDLLNIRYWVGSLETGTYSKLQLFSKILYFAPVTLLQVTLPYYVQALKGEGSSEQAHSLRMIETLGWIASYCGVGFFAVTGTWIAQHILGVQGLDAVDIVLSCLAVPPLYGLLSSLQIFAAAKKALWCAVLLGCVVGSMGICAVVSWTSLHQYLVYSAAMNTSLGFIAWIMTRRWIQQIQLKQADKKSL